MAKRKFALVVLLLVGVVVTTSQVNAQSMLGDNGCAVLDDVEGRRLLLGLVLEDTRSFDHSVADDRGAHSCSNSTISDSSVFRVSLLSMPDVTDWSGSSRMDSGSFWTSF